MECPSCLLRYNSKIRIPKVISCGHTICETCLKKTQKCRICGTDIILNKHYALNFSLMEIIQKDTKQIDKYVKVCFVGSSTTGKTSLIKRMTGNDFSQETVTTIGYDFSFQDREVDNLHIRYQLWDSAGQQKYRSISPIHYKNSDIVIIVYDVSQSATNNKISFWIQQTIKNCSQNVKIIIIGNKIDLIKENKILKPIDQQAWNKIQDSNYKHFQISCKTATGIKQFWQILDDQFRKKLKQKRTNMQNFDKELQEIQKKRQKVTKIKKKNQKNSGNQNSKNSNSCC